MLSTETLATFGWLLWRDVRHIIKNFGDKVVDALIWSINYIIINTYIMPLFGVTETYGAFIWVGTIVTMAFFEAIYCANDIVADLAGDNVIEYHCTLPIPVWLLFIKMGISAMLHCMVLSICNVPLGMIMLYGKVDLSHANWFAFAAVFFAMNLFFGFFGLWIASWARDGMRFAYVYRRVANPLWLFGGYQFSWYILAQAFPRAALLTLFNPVLYAFEGLRATILGSQGYLNIWLCVGMLLLYTLIFGVWSIWWMKKRIDAV